MHFKMYSKEKREYRRECTRIGENVREEERMYNCEVNWIQKIERK